MPSTNNSAARITSPWLTTTTRPSGWMRRRSNKAATTRSCTPRQLSPPGMAAMLPWQPAQIRPDLIKGPPGPLAKIKLDQIVPGGDRQIETPGEDRGGVAGSFERAGVNRLDRFAREARGNRFRFRPPARRQADATGPAGDDLALQRMFAMPHEIKKRHVASPLIIFARRDPSSRPAMRLAPR